MDKILSTKGRSEEDVRAGKEALTRFCEVCESRFYRPGEVMVTEGEDPKAMGVIFSGGAEATIRRASGRSQ
ncbi:hypothetical protein T484DRAFT_1815499, partial [Baffinella frigidus]